MKINVRITRTDEDSQSKDCHKQEDLLDIAESLWDIFRDEERTTRVHVDLVREVYTKTTLEEGDVILLNQDQATKFGGDPWYYLVLKTYTNPGHQGRGGMDESYPPTQGARAIRLSEAVEYDPEGTVISFSYNSPGWMGNDIGEVEYRGKMKPNWGWSYET